MYAESEALHEKTVEVLKEFRIATDKGYNIPHHLRQALTQMALTYARVHGEKELSNLPRALAALNILRASVNSLIEPPKAS